MIKLLKYSCPSCGKRKFKAPAGFLGLLTACSDECKTAMKLKAERQFYLWGFSDGELNKMYWRAVRGLVILDQDPKKLIYTDFICWLYLKHGYSKIEMMRVYSGIMEK